MVGRSGSPTTTLTILRLGRGWRRGSPACLASGKQRAPCARDRVDFLCWNWSWPCRPPMSRHPAFSKLFVQTEYLAEFPARWWPRADRAHPPSRRSGPRISR
ncbi:hypothetical protein ACU4GD_37705 [Cupriavidus basilensis]